MDSGKAGGIMDKIIYIKVAPPVQQWPENPVSLTDKTMERRLHKVLIQMETKELDALCIYADREHGGNFGYLTGFEPRFEEAVLVLHRGGKAFLLLGNESLRMGNYCRIQNTVIHVPHFSLPNQPMETEFTLSELFEKAGICQGMHIGIVGWKLFTSEMENNTQLFEVPYMIVDSIKRAVGEQGQVQNEGSLFISPDSGVRVVNNANEIAHFEYGAALASDCVLEALAQVKAGKTELEVADCLAAHGQPVNVQTICATGERFTNAEVAPRKKVIAVGDTFSVTMGLRGGLTSRAGYIARCREDLPLEAGDYMEKMAMPYFAAAAAWYETVGIGVTGGEIYETVERILPKSEYGWVLNPGHLTSSEEWLCSPIEQGSSITLKSGMLLQMDIIPKRAGYGGASAEDGIAVADAALREEIRCEYPEVWERMLQRRKYMMDELGICLKDEILPMSDSAGYFRPYFLQKEYALKKKNINVHPVSGNTPLGTMAYEQ